jgi:fluoride exporter
MALTDPSGCHRPVNNALFPTIPRGTLAADLVGGCVIGLALAPQWRLFVMSGFCGALTTFSTFSAEVVT